VFGEYLRVDKPPKIQSIQWKKLFMTCLALYFLTFSFMPLEAPVTATVYTMPTVFMDPLDAALVALGAFNVSETLRKRSLGHQPKER
jgi:hypothetical protein